MILDLLITCFFGITEVLIIGIIGALIINITSSDAMGILSKLFVRITLPCLVFYNMATNFSTGGVPLWWVFPLLGIALFLAGGLLAFGYLKLDRSVKLKGIFTASVTFHNSIMLPLAFAPVLFSSDRLPAFLNLLFLYNILTIPAFFSVGVWMMHSSAKRKFRVSDLLTPPIVATVLGLLFAVTGWNLYLPIRVMSQLKIFGSLSTPLSILIVGGVIVESISKFSFEDWKEPVKIAALKSFVLPVLAAFFVFAVRPPEYIALFIILGSVMPVGSTIAVVIPREEDIQKTVAGGILLTYLASIPAVPVFISIFGIMYGWH